jgi:hypothetical protein
MSSERHIEDLTATAPAFAGGRAAACLGLTLSLDLLLSCP